MKKRVFALLLATVTAWLMLVTVTAEDGKQYLLDYAGLLSGGEAAALEKKLDALGEKYSVDVAVVTLHGPENEALDEIPDGYVESLYDRLGLGGKNGGLLLLFSVGTRDLLLHYDTIIDMDTADSIREAVTPYLSDGEYPEAFDEFVSECDYYINGELNGYPFPWVSMILISLGVGLVSALIVTGVMRGQLKSVRFSNTANNYVVRDSLKVTESRDVFLYSTVSRRRRPQNNSSSRGGGGTSSRGTSRGKV